MRVLVALVFKMRSTRPLGLGTNPGCEDRPNAGTMTFRLGEIRIRGLKSEWGSRYDFQRCGLLPKCSAYRLLVEATNSSSGVKNGKVLNTSR